MDLNIPNYFEKPKDNREILFEYYFTNLNILEITNFEKLEKGVDKQ